MAGVVRKARHGQPPQQASGVRLSAASCAKRARRLGMHACLSLCRLRSQRSVTLSHRLTLAFASSASSFSWAQVPLREREGRLPNPWCKEGVIVGGGAVCW